MSLSSTCGTYNRGLLQLLTEEERSLPHCIGVESALDRPSTRGVVLF